MKRLTVVYIAFITVFIAGCKKQQVNTFFITAQKNNVNYKFAVTPVYTYKDSLTIIGIGTEERLNIRIKLNGVGKYLLKGNQGTYYNTVGQDALVSNYSLDASAESVFNITDYNQSANTISGNFNLVMIRTYGNPETAYPKNLNFSNGKFKVQLAQ